jgi:divalent metal cation (Fe/Co/Zn/Cd) transporter
MEPPKPATNRSTLALRGKRLEYFTIIWNCLEGLIGVAAGTFSGSISLVGFGIDSFIEVTSGAALFWRMSRDADEIRRERAELLALRVVGISFLGLAAYLAFEAISALLHHAAEERSFVGIGLAIASLFVMPFLARAKRDVAAQLSSTAMVGDAKQTAFCAYLSAILLAGLVLKAVFGLWWADPAAALVMAPIIGKEGVDAVRGKIYCDGCR